MNRSPDTPDSNSDQQDSSDRLQKLRTTQNYPWMTGILALVVVGYFLIISQPHLIAFYQPPELILHREFQWAVAAIFFCIALWEVRRFFRQRRQIELHIQKLRTEIDDIWRSKKALQARAHIYSGHADKLKLFISDKLLEYIEYDEKFLHFKSIAAEVRHNGVISYDKVRTALNKAVTELSNPPSEDQDNADRSQTTVNPYQEALDAMRYLWDLLDLSTTDNIALHIGNFLIECEEHYYQQILNRGSDHAMPVKADFSPASALLKTLSPLVETTELEDINGILKPIEKNNTDKSEETTTIDITTKQFRIVVDASPTLLGNENHLILMLENLIKNAQFFANKTAYKQKSDRILVRLYEHHGHIHFGIYNRGPHIDDSDKEQIFQLGYSTRRVKEHHGKGLGLFFVNEIVKGYQGHIQIENIPNQETTYSIRLALKGGEVVTRVVKATLEDGLPVLQEAGQEDSSRQLKWEFAKAVESIEVSSTSHPKTHVFNELDSRQPSQFLDPGESRIPQWMIEVKPKRSAHRVQFTALDTGGVQFHIRLPSADSRLNGEDAPFEEQLDDEVDRLSSQFKEFGEY
ncbi:sensor histidine kinase [Hahella ganghwensis]|uniref:sensor histidine kinase n=1 Tax=Hahella ganghwensis TaxID=286420 RepID=UPI00035C9ACF|nr:ATP-binding protein [Hahella ganghwensis]